MVGEALVVAEVEVGLGAVVGDEHLAVLIRRHRPRVDVEVGVELLEGDLEAPGFEERRQRRPRKRGGASKLGQIIGRVGIEQRPAEVDPRTRLGDWESDTLCGAPGSGGLATHVERVSRVLVVAKIENRTADHFAGRSLEAFRKTGVPRSGCLTLTADNGKEFAAFPRLEKGLGLKVYFARPHAPWERGANENTNGLIRGYFPKGTDFGKGTKAQVDRMTRSMNNRPRRCLGYQTPHEVFEKLAGVALQI